MASHVDQESNYEAPEMATGSRLAVLSVVSPLLAAILAAILVVLIVERLS